MSDKRIPIYNPYFPKLKTGKYERYLPSAFDESNSLLEKINNIIEYIRMLSGHYENTLENLDEIRKDQYERIEDLYDDFYKIKLWIESREEHLREDFWALEQWLKGAGLRLQTKHILTQWLNDGSLADLINQEVFDMKASKDDLDNADEFRHYESMISRKKKLKPMITITDDDGNRGFYTILYKLAKEYNIKMTSAMITSRAMGFPDDNRTYHNRYYHFDEVMEMHKSGLIEFVSHTHSHNLNFPSMSDQEIMEDFKTTKKFMEKYGFNHRCVVYPGGNYNERILEFAKQYFDYSTGTGGGAHNDKGIVTPPVNNYRLGRYNLNKPLSEVKDMIDKTVEENGWLIMIGHIDQQGATEQDYRDIIEYALSKNVEFVTLEEGVKTHANIAQFGGTNMQPETTISSHGEIFSDNLGKVIVDKSSDINIDTPIYYFKPETITHSIIRLSQSSGFPDSLSGLLATYRMSENEMVWSYQTFTTTREKEFYVRYWDIEEDDWTEFIPSSMSQRLPANSVKIDTKPSDRLISRKITYCPINSQSYENFPEKKSGILITNASQRDTFAYQEYYIIRENKVYKRWWNGSSWNDWVHDHLEFNNRVNGSIYSDSSTHDDFKLGLTIFRISGGASSGSLPNNIGGTFTTYKMSENESGWTYQEFVEYNSRKKFIRYATSNDTWSEWKIFVTETP